MAAFFLACFGIIAGGAYHSHCSYLGLPGWMFLLSRGFRHCMKPNGGETYVIREIPEEERLINLSNKFWL